MSLDLRQILDYSVGPACISVDSQPGGHTRSLNNEATSTLQSYLLMSHAEENKHLRQLDCRAFGELLLDFSMNCKWKLFNPDFEPQGHTRTTSTEVLNITCREQSVVQKEKKGFSKACLCKISCWQPHLLKLVPAGQFVQNKNLSCKCIIFNWYYRIADLINH